MAQTVPAEPLVAVAIPALNEAGKIARVLDKFPRDGRFEAIVVDDGSTDGTGDEARAHGAALVIRHEQRGGVGNAIRDGWKAGLDDADLIDQMVAQRTMELTSSRRVATCAAADRLAALVRNGRSADSRA